MRYTNPRLLYFTLLHDVITSVNFCDYQLRGLGVAGRGGQLSIYLRRRPYNVRVCDVIDVSSSNSSSRFKECYLLIIGTVDVSGRLSLTTI